MLLLTHPPADSCGSARATGLRSLFGFRFGFEKRTLSLSVDHESIEVIMVIAVVLIRKYSQCSARHVPSFAYFPDFGSNGNTWQRWAGPEPAKSRQIKSGSRLGGMAERFNAPVLKTGDPQGSVGSNPTPSAIPISALYTAYYESNVMVWRAPLTISLTIQR